MANIDDFKTALKYGGFRPNQFKVYITFPTAMNTSQGLGAQELMYVCRAASVPLCAIQNAQLMYRGRQVNFAGERVYQPWVATFYLDVDQRARIRFEEWSEYIREMDATNGTIIHENYYGSLEVIPMDRNDNPMRSYKLFDAYPANISQITLNYEANNVVAQFDVEFQYNYFTFEDVTSR